MFTKFIKIETNLKDSDIDNFNLSNSDRNKMIDIFSKFDYVEFKRGDSNCFFCVIHIYYIPQLLTFLSDIYVEFTYTDLTKDILYRSLTTTKDLCFESEEEIKFVNMTDKFINDNLSVDIVLDKILELGKDALNSKDIQVLESF